MSPIWLIRREQRCALQYGMKPAQAQKRIEEWRVSIPPRERRELFENVMDAFFTRVPKAGGSHLLAWEIPEAVRRRVESMHGQPTFAPDGTFHVPVKGREVKKIYVKQALHVLDALMALEDGSANSNLSELGGGERA